MPAIMVGGRKCVFCGAQKATREDVFEREINKILGISAPVAMTKGQQAIPVRPEGTTLDVVVRATCKDCNNIWLNGIWGRFRDLMKPAMRNESPVALSIQGQMDVSMWAVKTALLLEMATRAIRGNSWLPVNHFGYLRREEHPPPGTEVRLFRVDAENKVAAWHQAGVLGQDKDRPVAYIATFTIGYLGLQVLGRKFVENSAGDIIFDSSPIEPPNSFRDILQQILPVTSSRIIWPPRLAVRVEELPLIASWASEYMQN
jgi:hypothetical protein